MPKKLVGVILVSVTVLFWGISFVSTEFLLRTMGSMMIAFIRFVIGTITLFVILRFKGPITKIKKEHYIYFWLSGGIGIALYFYFENEGILRLGSSISGLLIATTPVFTMIFDAIIYKHKIKKRHVLAVFLSIAGVVLIAVESFEVKGQGNTAIGYALMMAAVIIWLVYALSTKKALQLYGEVEVTFYQFLFSLPFYLPFLLFDNTKWHAITAVEVGHILFLALISSVLGFYLYNRAIVLIGVTECSLFINFIPVITIVTSMLYLGTTITFIQVIGCILIILSASLAVLYTPNVEESTI